MKTIKSMIILVNDQQAALDFYTQKLGFVVKTDAIIGAGNRWLIINYLGQENFEFALTLAVSEEAKSKVGKQLDEVNALFGVKTDNIEQDLENFKKDGVKIKGDLINEPYGKFLFIEDLYGNGIYLHEEK